MRALRAIAGALFGALALAAPAHAETFEVTNTNDAGEGSLRAAIAAANASEGEDTIDATGVSGTIQLVSPLPAITEPVEIQGPGSDELTVRRSGGGAYRILDIQADEPRGAGWYEISGLTLTRGHATDGGGMRTQGRAYVVLRDVVIRGNRADREGGGVFHDGILLSIHHSTIAANRAMAGGGVRAVDQGDLALARSLVSGNEAWEAGGGLLLESSTLSFITRSTIAANSVGDEVDGWGGGIASSVALSVQASTIANNAAAGAANVGGAEVYLVSSIVAGALNGAGCDWEPASAGHNLVDEESCALDDPTDQVGVDPLLGPLTDNGGPTLTMAPRPGSPAIDQGYFTSPDQRGLDVFDFPGIANAPGGNGADVGAVEVQDVAPPTVKIKRTRVNRKRRAVAVRFAARDDAATPAQLELACKLDRRKFRPCSSPVKYKRLAPGRHRVVVRATDLAGKTTRVAKRFRVKKAKR